MKLRPYQLNAVNSVWEYFKSKNGNPLIAMPTGTGKSLVISGFIKSVFNNYPNQKIVVVTHVKELIVQNSSKLKEYWDNAPFGIFSAGLRKSNFFSPIIFCGIGSVYKKAKLFGHVDLLIVDECHLIGDSPTAMYSKFIDDLKSINPNLKVIGLTATPYRLKNGLLTEGPIFTHVCYDITELDKFNDLIDEGYIVPLIPRCTDFQIETDNLHLRGGEFINKELDDAVNKNDVTIKACNEIVSHAQNTNRKHWLIFSVSIEHSFKIKDYLTSIGISCGVIHSSNSKFKMTNSERDNIISEFKKGNITALINTDILTTGFDFPGIDLIGCLRPTMSPGLWVQMLGRGTRPVYAQGFDLGTTEGRLLAIQHSSKQNCLVLDFASNTKRLGPINDPVIPRKRKRKKSSESKPVVKVCPQCSSFVPAKTKLCKFCAYEFPFEIKIKEKASNSELIVKSRKKEKKIIEWYDVKYVSYKLHRKKGKPTTLHVSYTTDKKVFDEYICFEHSGFPQENAIRWWRARTKEKLVLDSKYAFSKKDTFKIPKRIRVNLSKPYPAIINYEF